MSKENDDKPQDAGDAQQAPPQKRVRLSKLILIILEATGVISGLLFLLVGLLLWRLTSGPIDIGFARDYIEQALYDPVSSSRVRLGNVVLEWPDLHGPLALRLYKASLISENHRVLAVDEVEVGVSGPALLAGRVLPITIALNKPSLRLVRAEDGRISFSVQDDDDTDNDDDTAVALRIRSALEQIDGRVNPRSPLARLRGVEINGASLLLEDHVLGMSWYLPDFNVTLSRDEAGIVMISTLKLPETEGAPSQIQFNAAYSSRKDGSLHAHMTLENVDPRIVSRKVPSLSWLTPQKLTINGGADVTLDKNMNVAAASLSVTADKGTLEAPGVYAEPVPFQDMEAEMTYDGGRKILDISKLAMTLQGVRLAAGGRVQVGGNGDNNISMPLRIAIPELPQEKIAALWPQTLHGTSLEEWLVHRLSKGTIRDLSLGFTVGMTRDAPDAEWKTDVTDIAASFGIDGMMVDYRPPLMPARDISAKGSFVNDVLEFDIASAHVGELDVTKGKVTIDHIITEGQSMASINIDLKGSLPEVFHYIASEPISMDGSRLGLNAADIKGQAALNVDVSFPALKELLAEQVKVAVAGTLQDVTLPGALKTLPLTGGPMALKVADGQVSLSSADAKLDGRPLTFEWQQYLETAGKPYSSRITADIVSDDDLRAKMGLGLEDWVEGKLPIKVTYTEMQNGQSTAEVQADVTPAKLMVKPLAFEKPAGAAGTAQCTLLMQNGHLREIKDLTVKAADVAVDKAHLAFETVKDEAVLRSGEIPAAKLGDSEASVTFTVAADGQMKFDVHGKSLDARAFLDGEKKEKKATDEPGKPLVVSVDVDRMRTHGDRYIEKTSLDLDLNGDGLVNRMELNATAGSGAIFVKIAPDAAGRLALQFDAGDAGATLRAFGIYENVKGGTLAVSGQSTDPARPRVISGRAQLKDFRVINAPVLARLVSLISPTGLPQLLSNEGLYFSRLDAKFNWHMRAPGDLYIIRDGRTSGSSLGLTFAGTIDKEKNAVDLEGHVVPLSEVNNLISNIPLVGNILTGGNGALFAATYTLRGPVKDPQVSVNPLSVLAPGILRRILFESGD